MTKRQVERFPKQMTNYNVNMDLDHTDNIFYHFYYAAEMKLLDESGDMAFSWNFLIKLLGHFMFSEAGVEMINLHFLLHFWAGGGLFWAQ